MGFALEHFFCCLELQLGGIIMAWWGMIFGALSIIGVISSLVFGKETFSHLLPFHVNTGSAILTAVILILIFAVYFWFSYQLLLGTQSGNSSQMFGYLVIHGIVVVIFILGVFSNAASLVAVVLYAYLWFCIYSLYVRTGGTGIV